MSKVALLIGVSRYPPGLNPLPRAQKDVEVMKRVLKQPHLQFKAVVCLHDRPLQETKEVIEAFFKHCTSADQVIFLFSGYVILDTDDRLYFATPSTTFDEQGRLIKSRTISVSFVRDAMNGSPAKQQVVILDGYFWQVGSRTAETERTIDFPTQLGHENRVILTTTASTRQILEPAELDVWSYTRYLAEAIETGVADSDRDGMLTAEGLHNYANRKLRIAAPTMQPQIYGSEVAISQPLLAVPLPTPIVSYRKLLEDSLPDDINTISLLWQKQPLFDDVRRGLELSPQEAVEVEAQVLRPFQDYQQRIQLYQEKIFQLTPQSDALSNHTHQALKQLQQALYLTDNDTAAIEVAPYMAEQQKQREAYQKNLARYEQVLLAAMQHQYPIDTGDREILKRLQQVLQLKDEDANAAEEQLATQVTRLQQASASPDGQVNSIRPEAGTSSSPSRLVDSKSLSTGSSLSSSNGSAESHSPPLKPLSRQTTPPPTPPVELVPATPPESASASAWTSDGSNDPSASPEASISNPAATSEPPSAKETVLQQLIVKNISHSVTEPTVAPETPQKPDSVPVAPASAVENAPSPIAVSPDVPPTGRSPRRIMRSLTELNRARLIRILFFLFMAIALPLTALAVASIMTGRSLPELLPFRSSSNSAASPQNAQTLIAQGLSKSQAGYNQEAIEDYSKAIATNPQNTAAYINRGVAYHKLGKLGDALNDFNRAHEINPQSALAINNRSHVYFDRQDYQRAFDDANAAIALNPRLAEAYINLANAQFKRNDISGALQNYNTAIQLKPADAKVLAGAYNNRGNVRFSVNAPGEALRDYSQAIALNPNYADAYYNRAVVFQAQNNLVAASNDFQQAATLYQNLGNPQMSKDAQNKAKTLRQSNPKALPNQL